MSARGEALVLGLLAFLSFAVFTPQFPGNDQVVTRLALTLAIVENGALTIDRFADRTVDKAEFGGHVYADKAPGLSLLAVPAVALARPVLQAAGQSTDARDREVFARYSLIATLATNGIVSAVAVALLYLSAMRLGAAASGARYGAAALAVATPFLGWSTAFFAHALSASLLLIVTAVATFACAGERRLLSGRPFAVGLLLGLLMGLTILTDFTTAPLLAIGAVVVLGIAVGKGGSHFIRTGAGLLLGGLVGFVPLLVYNQLAFGSPFTLGYAEVKQFTGMKQGVFGITWPDPAVAWELLFGTYRGLLPLAPVLLLAPYGLLRMLTRWDTRVVAVIIVAAVAVFLFINASYFYWKGGNSTGPRFLTPMLPFLCLALAFAWPRGWARVPAAALLALSAAIALLCAGVTMFAPENIIDPMREYLLPGLRPLTVVKCVAVFCVWALALALIARRSCRMAAVQEPIATR